MRGWLIWLALIPATAYAQTVRASLENVTRVESWSFFQPPPDGGEPDYTFPATRVRFGVEVDAERLALAGAFSYVRAENLPPDAIGPLALGSGAFYYASSGAPYSYQLYLSELTLSVRSPNARTALTFGRMRYESGAEPPAASPAVGELRRLRLNGRLVSAFDWSMYQRRFDGVRVDVNRDRWTMTGAVLLPTQGGYEESANLTIPKVQVGGGAWTLRSGRDRSAESQVFAYAYRDRRHVQVRPDNTGQPVSSADVTLATIGGSHVRVFPTRRGRFDVLLWGAGQVGDWYGQSHRASAFAGELGYRWNEAPVRPWLRAGVLASSGDGDYADDRHHTFFPMVPNSRTFALSAVYTQMNVRDTFVHVLVDDGTRWNARVDWHHLVLASAGDRWYHGSGAISRDGFFFGFSGRPSGGATALGQVLEGTLDVRLTKYWRMNGYVGRMSGGDVVRASFVDDRLLFWYVENVLGF